MLERVHGGLLVAFAAAIALLEGPAQILCVLLVLTTLATGRAKRPGVFEAGVLLWWVAGLIGVALVGGERGSQDLTRPLGALAAFVGAHALGREDPRRARVAWAFGAALAVNAAYGYAQVAFQAMPMDRWFLKQAVSPQIMVPNQWGTRLASGLYYNRLKLAHVGITGVALAGFALLDAARARRLGRALLFAAAATFVAGAVILTYARMALLALAIGVVVVLALEGRWRLVVSAVAAAGLAFLAFSMTAIGKARLATLGSAAEGRDAMVALGLEIFRDHPWFGVGHGGYRAAALRYAEGDWAPVRLTSPHNQLVQVMAETGLVGLAGFSIAVLVALWSASRRLRRAPTGGDRMTLFVLVSALVLGLSHFTLHHVPVALLFWSLAGHAAGGRSESE